MLFSVSSRIYLARRFLTLVQEMMLGAIQYFKFICRTYRRYLDVLAITVPGEAGAEPGCDYVRGVGQWLPTACF